MGRSVRSSVEWIGAACGSGLCVAGEHAPRKKRGFINARIGGRRRGGGGGGKFTVFFAGIDVGFT